MLRAAAVSLSLLFSLSSFSATLGPERRVAPIQPLTRAANGQGGADVATDGRGFVSVWTDTRAIHDSVYNQAAIFAAHVAADGTEQPATGILLGLGNTPRIASAGDGYVTVYADRYTLYSQRLDTNGRPVGDRLTLVTNFDPSVDLSSLVSNGRGYLVVFANGNGFERLFLDTNGRAIGSPVPVPEAFGDMRVVVTADGLYHLIFTTIDCATPPAGCGYNLTAVTLDDRTGASSTTVLLPRDVYVRNIHSAATSGNAILVLFAVETTIYEQVFDASGTPVSQRHALAPKADDRATVSAEWDGRTFLAIVANASSITAQRISTAGDVLDSTPMTIAGGGSAGSAAFDGSRTAVVYSAGDQTVPYDVYARVVSSFADLASGAGTAVRLSNAPPAQRNPAATYANGQLITVWREGDGNGSIVAAVGGTRLLISSENAEVQHDPDVSAVGNSVLVAWRSDTSAAKRVYGSLIQLNGIILIASQPFLIDEYTAPDVRVPSRDGVSIATSGHEFFVAWSRGSIVRAKRVSLTGTVLDAQAINAAESSVTYVPTAVHAIWVDGVYAVVYATDLFWPYGAPPPLPAIQIYVARVTQTGVPLDGKAPIRVYNQQGSWIDLTATAWGDRLLIAWIDENLDGSSIYTVRSLDATLSELVAGGGAPRAMETFFDDITYPGHFNIAAASHAGMFAAIWTRGSGAADDTHAVIVGQGERFVVPATDVFDVAATGSGNGFTFVYSRRDDEAASVPQLFARDLSAAVARRRAVR